MKATVSIIGVCVLVAALSIIPALLEAQPGGGQGGGRPQGPPPQGTGQGEQQGPPQEAGPPEEALAACEGKSEGATCEFTGPRNDPISGTCQTIEEQLACVPEGGPQGGPPPNSQQQGGQN